MRRAAELLWVGFARRYTLDTRLPRLRHAARCLLPASHYCLASTTRLGATQFAERFVVRGITARAGVCFDVCVCKGPSRIESSRTLSPLEPLPSWLSLRDATAGHISYSPVRLVVSSLFSFLTRLDRSASHLAFRSSLPTRVLLQLWPALPTSLLKLLLAKCCFLAPLGLSIFPNYFASCAEASLINEYIL